jgi:hypothetical protein
VTAHEDACCTFSAADPAPGVLAVVHAPEVAPTLAMAANRVGDLAGDGVRYTQKDTGADERAPAPVRLHLFYATFLT